MKVRSAAPMQGWQWIIDGFSLVRRAPYPLLPSIMLLLLTIAVLSAPVQLFQALASMASPALQFGYALITRAVDRREPITPWALYAGLNFSKYPKRARALLSVGTVLYLASIVVTLLVSSFAEDLPQSDAPVEQVSKSRGEGNLDGSNESSGKEPVSESSPIKKSSREEAATTSSLTVSEEADKRQPPRTPSDSALGAGAPGSTSAGFLPLALLSAVSVLLSTAFCFAPYFAGFYRTGPLKSIFFSIVTVWRNKGSFLVYCFGWIGVSMAFGLIVQLAIGLLGTFGMLITAPLFLILFTAFHCSSWCSFRDLIEEGDAQHPFDSPSVT